VVSRAQEVRQTACASGKFPREIEYCFEQSGVDLLEKVDSTRRFSRGDVW